MRSERRLRLLFTTALLVAGLSVSGSPAGAQVARHTVVTGRIIKDAPLRLLPDPRRGPLLIMEAGVLVQVNGREGTWVNVTVDGSQFGRRTGYVEAQFIEIVESQDADTPPRVTAADVIPPKTTAATTQVAATQPSAAQPVSTTAPRGQPQNTAARAPRAVGTSETFHKATISLTVEDKTRESDVIVRYEPNALVIVDKKNAAAMKTFPYGEMQGAEYSYAKNPRWKTAIFVSPFFLFTSGKKHWFLVQGTGDYALLHLDKSNYRLILAAFEARTGVKVETVADTK